MKNIILIICAAFIFAFNCEAYHLNYDVRSKSSISAENLDKNFRGKLRGTGKYFKEAEAKYNVNAVFLASIAIIESGNAKSSAAKSKNNFFGLMGKRGLKSFSSPKECIMYVAKLISNPKGHYYGKRRYTISAIGRKYAASKRWPSVISKTMKSVK